MARWPHDDPASLADFYGDPTRGEPGRQLVPVVPPFQMYYDGKPIRSIQFHSKAADALKAALDEIWDACGRDQAKLDQLRVSHYSGAYNPRYVRGYEPGNAQGRTPRWSNHAYGAAIDLDAEHNGFNTGHGTMPQFVIDAFKRQGALWGGDYKGRTDPMHFEFCSRGETVVPLPPRPQPPKEEPIDPPQAGGEEEPPPEEPTPTPAPPPVPVPEPKSPGFFGRMRNWVVGGLSSIGFGGIGALSDWKLAALLLGFLLTVSALAFALALWLFGKEKVAAWVSRHIA
jgi:hypothetical protein